MENSELFEDLLPNALQTSPIFEDGDHDYISSEEQNHDDEVEDVEEYVEWNAEHRKAAQEPSTSENAEGNGYLSFIGEEPIVEKEGKRRKGALPAVTVLSCDICGLVVKHPSKIAEHLRTHTGERPYSCDICGKRFTQKTPMLNHYRNHIGDRPFPCDFGCGRRFVNNARKNAHELRHLGLKRQGEPRPHLKPPKRMIGLTIPYSRLANDGPPPVPKKRVQVKLKVPNVDMKTTIARIEEVIESVVAGCAPPEAVPEKPKRSYLSERSPTVAQCTTCGLILKHPSKIKEHMKSHNGERPFQCGECGEAFTKACTLRNHIRRKHTGERPYACQWECGRNFVSVACRNEHEKIVHSGMKRYECLVQGCGRMFTRRPYLMKHRASQHSNIYTPIFNVDEVAKEENRRKDQLKVVDDRLLADGGDLAVYEVEFDEDARSEDLQDIYEDDLT